MTVAAATQKRSRGIARYAAIALLVVLTGLALAVIGANTAHALPADPVPPTDPINPAAPDAPSDGFGITINGPDGTPASSIVTILGITVLSIAPSLLLMMTSFTKIFIVLGMTRNALGLPNLPPSQVLAGLALFLTLFIMWPVIGQVNEAGIQPYINGQLNFEDALAMGTEPIRHWMLGFTREEDIALMTRAGGLDNPATPADVELVTLIPAFLISELRAAFIIGFVIFVPFLVIDLVVSSALMSMGMMMLPPVMISLPFKILLFILVDGWALLSTTLITSYTGG